MGGFSSITGDEAIVFADNASFDGTQRGGKMVTDGQLWIGATASNRPNNGGHVRLGSLTSPSGSITIGYSAPNITIDLAGGTTGIDSIAVDTTTGAGTNPVLPTAGGLVTFTGGQYATGTFGTRVITINSTAANTLAVEAQISTTSAASLITNNGISHFNSAQFTIDANGFVSSKGSAFNYTDVVGPTTYAVLSTDYYISCNTTGGAITLNFPNAPTARQIWIVKDRTGNAAASNITITTPGGVVTIDGVTTYTIASNYGAINLLANATPTYEVF